MIMRTLFLAWALAATTMLPAPSSAQFGVTMTSEYESVSGSAGQDLEIGCTTEFESPEQCRFYRPDGQLVCPSLDDEEEVYLLTDGDACVEDPKLTVNPPSGNGCSLEISGLVESVHRGSWRCEVTIWDGETGQTTIDVGQKQQEMVEFENVWGDITVDAGSESKMTLTCRVFSSDYTALRSKPGDMTWRVGGNRVKVSDRYTKNLDGDWVQSYEYDPDLYDDEQTLECSVGEEAKDSIKLLMIMFRPAEEAADPFQVAEGQAASVPLTFEAYPRPGDEDVYWVLDTPKDPALVLRPGEEKQRFKASDLEEVGPNKYQATLDIKKVAKWERDHTHKLVVEGGRDNVEPQEIAVNLDVQAAAAPPPPPPAVVLPAAAAPSPSPPPAVSDASPAGNSTEAEAVAEAGSSGVSLYIIIAIICLVILLCALFYCTKWCKKRRQQQQAQDLRNANAGLGAGGAGAAAHKDAQHEAKLEASRKAIEADLEAQEPLFKTASAAEAKQMEAYGGGGGLPNSSSRMVKEDEVIAQRAVTVDTEAGLIRKIETPSPNSVKSVDTKSTGVNNSAENVQLSPPGPFLRPAPLPVDHPTREDERNEIERMALEIRQLTEAAGGGGPACQPAAAEEVMLAGEPVIKLESVRRHGEDDEEVVASGEPIIRLESVDGRRHGEPDDDVLASGEPRVEKVIVSHARQATPITPPETADSTGFDPATRNLSWNTGNEEDLKAPQLIKAVTHPEPKVDRRWRDNALFRAKTVSEDSSGSPPRSPSSRPAKQAKKTPSSASTMSARSQQGRAPRWESMDYDEDESGEQDHAAIMEQVERLVRHMREEQAVHEEANRDTEHSAIQDRIVGIRDSLKRRKSSKKGRKYKKEDDGGRDVNGNDGDEHRAIMVKAASLRSDGASSNSDAADDISSSSDDNAPAVVSAAPAASGNEADEPVPVPVLSNEKTAATISDAGPSSPPAFAGGFVAPAGVPASPAAMSVDEGVALKSPSVASTSTQTPRLKHKAMMDFSFDSNSSGGSSHSLDTQQQQKENEKREAEQSMYM